LVLEDRQHLSDDNDERKVSAMKRLDLRICGCLCAGLMLGASGLRAQTQSAATLSQTAPTLAAVVNPSGLPYGVEDILKLSRAQISDDIIINYIRNSGTVYNLAPKDIVYLRDQGVSDAVVNAMLNQRKKAVETSQASEASQAEGSSGNDVAAGYAAYPPIGVPPVVPVYAPVYVPPPPVEVQQQPASTLFIIPYRSTAPAACYPAYSGYTSSYLYFGPQYCAPAASFVVGIGGGPPHFGYFGHFGHFGGGTFGARHFGGARFGGRHFGGARFGGLRGGGHFGGAHRR
jgi:hypothetical protein